MGNEIGWSGEVELVFFFIIVYCVLLFWVRLVVGINIVLLGVVLGVGGVGLY